MKRFVKIDLMINSNPKCRKAGYAGVSAYMQLIVLHGNHMFDWAGTIPTAYAEFEYLCRECGVEEADREFFRRGLELAERNTLFSYLSTGEIRLTGWNREEWGVREKSTDRVRSYRERNAVKHMKPVAGVSEGYSDHETKNETHETLKPVRLDPEKEKDPDPKAISPAYNHTHARVEPDRAVAEPVAMQAKPEMAGTLLSLTEKLSFK